MKRYLGGKSGLVARIVANVARSAASRAAVVLIPYISRTTGGSVANASREPSGDQRGSPHSPRAVNSCLAGADPSSGATQIWPPLMKVTTSLRGETTGSSPSLIGLGSPPSKGTLKIWTLGGTGFEPTFTGSASSQFEP